MGAQLSLPGIRSRAVSCRVKIPKGFVCKVWPGSMCAAHARGQQHEAVLQGWSDRAADLVGGAHTSWRRADVSGNRECVVGFWEKNTEKNTPSPKGVPDNTPKPRTSTHKRL